MKLAHIRPALVRVAAVLACLSALVALVGLTLVGGERASAAASPSYEPDPAAVGTLTFYDAAGHQITSGNVNDSPLAAYYKASGNGVVASDNLASVAYATPQDGVPTLSWTTVETWTSTQAFGSSVSHPGDLAGLPNAIVAGASTDGGLQGHIDAFPSASTANPNVYQVRIYTNHSGSSGNTNYYSADVQVNTTTGIWTQVYPTPPVIKVNTALTTPVASPVSPTPHGSSVTITSTLTATDASHPAGAVHLFDNAGDLGTATFTAATGAVAKTVTPADGSHSYTFQFTPTDTAGYNGVTSAALPYTVNPVQATTTALAIYPSGSATVGDTVTLTATLTPNTAAGSVQFFDGTTAIGAAAAVSGGTATTSTTALSQGSHNLKATFVPAAANVDGASTSPVQAYTINPKAAVTTTAALTVTPPSPSQYGANLTLSASITPSNAVGTVKFFDGITQIGATQTWAGSVVSVSSSTLGAGAHNLSAQFTATNPVNFSNSSATGSYTIDPAATTTTVTTTPASPVVQNTAVSLKATVGPSGVAGKVQFFDNGSAVGTPQTVAAGAAAFSYAFTTTGSHAVTGTFTPTSANYASSTSATLGVTVNPPPPGDTTMALTATPANSVITGTAVTLKGTVAPATAAGSVEFFDGTTSLGTAAVNSGVATKVVSGLALGSHSVTATFAPTNNYKPSTSTAITINVIPPPTATTTTLTLSPAGPVDFGTSVTFDATVTPPAAVGAVQFFDDTTLLGSSPLASGAATFATTALASGAHPKLSAKFVPSDPTAFDGSPSAAVSMTVNAQATTTSLAASPTGPVGAGNSVSLKALVTPTTAAGTVKFADAGTEIGSVALAAGKATLTTTTLGAGDHTLTATFVPSSTVAFTGSVSAEVKLAVKPAPVLGAVTDSGTVVAPGSELKPGDRLTVSATGFQPEETVTAIAQSTPVIVGTTTATAGGAVTITVTLPANLAAGAHSLTVKGALGSVVFPFTVAVAAPTPAASTPSGPTPSARSGGGNALPNTGATVLPLMVTATVLLLAGGGVILLTRRRRHTG